MKTDLTDTTFLIAVRIDSDERLDNLEIVIDFIKTSFNTYVIVLEADKKEQINSKDIDKKVFVEDYDPIFHQTKYINQLEKLALTPFIAIWNADVILNPSQILEGIQILRNEKASMVIPYDDNRIYTIKEPIKNQYKTKKKLEILYNNLKNKHEFSVGVVLVNRQQYIDAGRENENFYGWGNINLGRIKCWEILDYKIERIEGTLFHFNHERLKNSQYTSKALEYGDRMEFIRLCRISTNELREKIQDQGINNNTLLKIGLAVIATGKYLEMAITMINSARRFFFKKFRVTFFVFSDGYIPESEDLCLIKIKHEQWPYPTLKKFHYLCENKNVMRNIDYLFLCDADMLFVDEVDIETLPFESPFLLGVTHPGFYKDNKSGTYESNPISCAYISKDEQKKKCTYYAGGFNGGRFTEFIQMAEKIMKNINNDLMKGYIAIWHDESHINRYYMDNPPKLLSPAYCYPESWNLPFKKKLLALDKSHNEMRK